jgi:invasion protein IalB
LELSVVRARILLMAGVIAASPSFAQTPPAAPAKPAPLPPVSSEPETTTATYGVWTLRCTRRQEGSASVRLCEVDQGVVPQGQQNPIAQIGVGRLPSKEGFHITVVLPTDITFANAPKVSAQDKDPGIELTWRRCLPGGCIADAPLKEETLHVWRAVAADTGRLFFTTAGGRNLAVEFSFRGFSQAMDALLKEHS